MLAASTKIATSRSVVNPKRQDRETRVADALRLRPCDESTLTISVNPAAFFVQNAQLDSTAARLKGARGQLNLDGRDLTLAGDELALRGDLQFAVPMRPSARTLGPLSESRG